MAKPGRRFFARVVDSGRYMVAGQRLEAFVQDLRYATRMFRTRRVFSATAVLTIGLAAGLVTSIFSVAYSVLLQPLPYQRPSELTLLSERSSADPWQRCMRWISGSTGGECWLSA